MKNTFYLLLAVLVTSIFGGHIAGTVSNETGINGTLIVYAVDVLTTDPSGLMSSPNDTITSPLFPQYYLLESDLITRMSSFMVFGFIPTFLFPASGDPFGIYPYPVALITSDEIDDPSGRLSGIMKPCRLLFFFQGNYL